MYTVGSKHQRGRIVDQKRAQGPLGPLFFSFFSFFFPGALERQKGKKKKENGTELGGSFLPLGLSRLSRLSGVTNDSLLLFSLPQVSMLGDLGPSFLLLIKS